jgi:RHS repeat-associated protein
LTVFVYDAAGQLVAEYSTQIETASPKVSYLTTDHLGSPRIATDAGGGVISRRDFTAFGEEVVTAQRTGGTTGNGYDTPNVRQDYTGYQKDLESGLEFAQARYYNTRHGRFTSVDPLPSSATIRNPQSFNRYSYSLNSPYKFTDPLGLIPGPATMGGCSAAYSSCYGGVPGSELEAYNFTAFKDLTVKQQQLLMTFFNTTDAKEAAKKWGDYTLTNGEQAATFLAITNALSKTTLDTGNGTKVSALDAITSIKDIKDDRIYGTMDAAITKKWQDEGKGGYTIDRADGKKETGQAKFNKGKPLVASRHENPYDPKVGKPGKFNKFEFQAVTEDLRRIQWNYTYATQIVDVDIDYIPFNNPWHKSHGNSLVIEHYDDYVKKFGNPGFNVRVKPRK